MAYSHCRIRIRIPTLYYAEFFTLVMIWIPVRIVSQMVTVPILGMYPLSHGQISIPIPYISIRGSESESEPTGNFSTVQGSVSQSGFGNVNKPLPQ